MSYDSLLKILHDLYSEEIDRPYVDLTLICRIDGAIQDVKHCAKMENNPIPVLKKYHGRVYSLLTKETRL